MANTPVQVRLRPIVLAYLDELDRIGGYGKGRVGVIKRFIENVSANLTRDPVLDESLDKLRGIGRRRGLAPAAIGYRELPPPIPYGLFKKNSRLPSAASAY